MFDFGFAELFLIIAVAVFFIGPKELPGLMQSLGRGVRRLQYIRYALSQQFEDFMREHELNEVRHFSHDPIDASKEPPLEEGAPPDQPEDPQEKDRN
jgi:sec-independent protein translocase protein TatB